MSCPRTDFRGRGRKTRFSAGFAVGTETGFGSRLITERVAPVEQHKNNRRRHRAAGRHHQPLPERTPAEQRLPGRWSATAKWSARARRRWRRRPEPFARTAVRAESIRAADKSQNRRQTAAGCSRPADWPKARRTTSRQTRPAATRSRCPRSTPHKPSAPAADPPARRASCRRPGKRRLAEHREKRGGQNQDGLKARVY